MHSRYDTEHIKDCDACYDDWYDLQLDIQSDTEESEQQYE